MRVSTSAPALKQVLKRTGEPPQAVRRIDLFMLAGIVVAIVAVIAGIAATGIRLSYFLQPTGVLIVLGGTLGVTLVTTPRRALQNSARRVIGLAWEPRIDREKLIAEIMSYVRAARIKGLLGIEAMIEESTHDFLRESLRLALDIRQRSELESALATKLRLRERQGETDAKTLEVAGGFAPTIGILGTVVGLIDVLRQFSNLSSVATGLGTAFVSTIYGLGLANLLLLPMAHRIRAVVAESFENEELIVEGTLSIVDGLHPSLVRERLDAYLK